jgi:hypothetical protein
MVIKTRGVARRMKLLSQSYRKPTKITYFGIVNSRKLPTMVILRVF